jgi:hypothetical protein
MEKNTGKLLPFGSGVKMNNLPKKTVNLSWDQAFCAEWNFDSGRL